MRPIAVRLLLEAWLGVIVGTCWVLPATVRAAARVPARESSPRLLQKGSLPHLMPGPGDLPADALLIQSRPPGGAAWARPSWLPGRSGWSVYVRVGVARSPEEAVRWALEDVFGTAAVRSPARLPEVKPVGPYAGLGERVWAKSWPEGAELEFVRGNATIDVLTSGRGQEMAVALARAIVRRVEAARAGHPEPAVGLPGEGPAARVGGSLRRSQPVSPWGHATGWLVFQVGDQFRRALPAQRMSDGDYLVPLLHLNRALNLPLDLRMDRGDPKRWRIRLGGKKLLVTLGRRQVYDGQRTLTLAHPVQTVGGAMVVPLSLLQTVHGWSITRGSWQGVGAVRLSPPPGRKAVRRPAVPANPRPLPPPTAREAKGADPSLAVAARVYGFDRWPGKHGRVRPGVSARAVLLKMDPPLREVRIHAPEHSGKGELIGPASVSWDARASHVGVTVYRTCEEAQKAALRGLAQVGRLGAATSGSKRGLRLGDVSFLSGEPDLARSVWFVRSNVLVSVGAQPGEAIDIAEALDRALLARPTAGSLGELSRFQPSIVDLGLEGDPAQPVAISRERQDKEGRAWQHPLRIRATDPGGGTVEYAWTALTPGAGVVKAKGSGYLIYIGAPWRQYGLREYAVAVTVANEYAMLCERTLSVKVDVVKGE